MLEFSFICLNCNRVLLPNQFPGLDKTRVLPLLDLRDYPDILDALNAIINNGDPAEIKKEGNGERLVVVSLSRQVKIKTPVKR